MKEDILRKVKETVREIEPSAEIYLYGSRACRDSREDSDWDFLILIEGAADTARTDRIRHRLERISLLAFIHPLGRGQSEALHAIPDEGTCQGIACPL